MRDHGHEGRDETPKPLSSELTLTGSTPLGIQFGGNLRYSYRYLKAGGLRVRMNRRTFLASSGVAAFATLVPLVSRFALAEVPSKTFEWKTNDLVFAFEVTAGKLRQKRMVPVGASTPGAGDSSGVEVALQCSGENSPDQGMKSGMGQPGARLIFVGTREESTPTGKRLACTHTDPVLRLDVESFYESFAGVPVVRRYTRVRNTGTSPAGIEFLSSAMLHGLAAPQDYDSRATHSHGRE